jgi:hypothetical protein
MPLHATTVAKSGRGGKSLALSAEHLADKAVP